MDHTTAHPSPVLRSPLTAPVHDAGRNRDLGARGEGIAAEYLEGLGYRLLQRNWRDGRSGELDLIALDVDTVVAVEVKTRSGTGYGHPLEAITAAKAGRLRRLLIAWSREHRPGPNRLRIDAIGIVVRPQGAPRITHLQGIA